MNEELTPVQQIAAELAGSMMANAPYLTGKEGASIARVAVLTAREIMRLTAEGDE